MKSNAVRLIFPHQLFADHAKAPKNTLLLLIEDDLFFKQYKFHKQKLVLHRASMRAFASRLEKKGFKVRTIETSNKKSMSLLHQELKAMGAQTVSYYDLVDDWLEQRLDKVLQACKLTGERLESPGFLTSRGQIEDYFNNNPNRMQNFYEWQRKRLKIMVDGSKPAGGKWSYDADNRKKLPKDIDLPAAYDIKANKHVKDAQKWVEKNFTDNYGDSEPFCYPVDHDQAAAQLKQFVQQRLDTFGPYEDAIARDESQLFHSVLSPLINIGLLTPKQVIDEVLDYSNNHDVPIASLEGFVRQVIGWREYMRATYLQFGREMRTSNYLEFDRKLGKGWWDGSTGLEPVDVVIKRLLTSAYAHHIERLMILGNSMVLLRIDPDQVYEWFMAMFIDAYDWVMVPNVYAMSQFAAGDKITTKPYVSGSNYIVKMSDFKKDDWADDWDALYWHFIADYRKIIEQNFRSRMVVNLYDRFDTAKKQQITKTANKWLK